MPHTRLLEPPLSLKLRPSRKFKQCVIFLHSLAMAASFSNSLPLLLQVFLCLGLSGHLHWQLTQPQPQIQQLQHTAATGWQIQTLLMSDLQAVVILPSTVTWQWLIFLHYLVDGKKHQQLIMHDALSMDEYRQLLVRLKTTVNRQPTP